jgi:hypothetical protein
MKSSSLIAAAAIAAASMYHPEYTEPPSIANGFKSRRRGYRKAGVYGTERRKTWLIEKNKELLTKNLEKKARRNDHC